jgi:hypothetical protein
MEELSSPDRISAEVNLGVGSAEAWKPVASVSPGQRATALLALVLLSSGDPLIIDQPEDDLDNQHIYEDIVRVLADVCQSRQVIVATHNANIPVLGDAELVVALNADADRSRLEAMAFKRILKDAELPLHFTPHCLRHTLPRSCSSRREPRLCAAPARPREHSAHRGHLRPLAPDGQQGRGRSPRRRDLRAQVVAKW